MFGFPTGVTEAFGIKVALVVNIGCIAEPAACWNAPIVAAAGVGQNCGITPGVAIGSGVAASDLKSIVGNGF